MAVDGLDFFNRLIERDAGIFCEPRHRAPAIGEDDPLGYKADAADPTFVFDPFQPERLHLILSSKIEDLRLHIETSFKAQATVHLPVSPSVILPVASHSRLKYTDIEERARPNR